MAGGDSKQMIVGLDIGTSKVVAVVGEIDADGGMEVVGIGSHPSRGMKKGSRGEYRVHRHRDTAGGGGSRADGGLPDPLGIRGDRRKPYPFGELPRHCRDTRSGGVPSRTWIG